jgi:hypothetical protein
MPARRRWVDLEAGAGAVWTVTSGAGLLRIDPRTARLTASLPGRVSAVATGAGGVWAVCCRGRGPRGRATRLDPASGQVIASVGLPTRPWPWGPDRAQCGSVAPRAGCGGWTRPVTGGPAPSGCQPSRGLGWCGGSTCEAGTEDRWEATGRHLAVTPGGMVWATSDTRLLGLGGPQVRGTRRNLHELETDRITAMAAAEDGGLWLGTAQRLFHVDRSVLRQGQHRQCCTANRSLQTVRLIDDVPSTGDWAYPAGRAEIEGRLPVLLTRHPRPLWVW